MWCGPSDWSSTAPLVCSDARGALGLGYVWNGCSGQFRSIYSNAAQFGWNNSSTNAGYDNSGCNSDSDMAAPVNAVAFRIGADTTAMQNAGYLGTELHSNDYYTAFTAAPSGGVLTNTFTAAQSGRLYLSRQGPGGSASQWNGTIRVTASYTPPPSLSFGLTWSPSANGVSQPYLFPVPSSNSSSALASAGLVGGRYLQIPDTFSAGATVTATFWVYQNVFSGTVGNGAVGRPGAWVWPAAVAAVVAVMALLM